MKGFLFDENIPIPHLFTPSLPVHHATELGQSMKDSDLWQLAISNAWVIVSKDTDFSDRIMQTTPPPWVVYLKFGNVRRAAF